jgi:hypothetical protein
MPQYSNTSFAAAELGGFWRNQLHQPYAFTSKIGVFMKKVFILAYMTLSFIVFDWLASLLPIPF